MFPITPIVVLTETEDPEYICRRVRRALVITGYRSLLEQFDRDVNSCEGERRLEVCRRYARIFGTP